MKRAIEVAVTIAFWVVFATYQFVFLTTAAAIAERFR